MTKVLTLFEERAYDQQKLLDLIGQALGCSHAPPEALKCPACGKAWKSLKAFTLPRANLVRPSPISDDSAQSDQPDGEDEALEQTEDDEDAEGLDCIRLLHCMSSGRRWKVKGLVGSGLLEEADLEFEVLPKVTADDGDEGRRAARLGLLRMWQVAEERPIEHEAQAGVDLNVEPRLHEWLVERFLGQVEALLARGIRQHYVEREDNLGVLRSRLLPQQNLLQNRFAPQRFYCRFEELSPDRPENRLVRAALERVAAATKDPVSRRRAGSLIERLHEVPASRGIRADFAAWRDDRLMVAYRDIRPTCRWILHDENPAPVRGNERLFGCFTRADKLFESYVANWLAKAMRGEPQWKGYRLREKIRKRFCWSVTPGRERSELTIPDLIIEGADQRAHAVLDTKWKRPMTSAPMARADLYQMVSYATFRLPWGNDGSVGTLSLIYPSTTGIEPSMHHHFERPMGGVTLTLHWFKLPTPRAGSRAEWDEGLGSDALKDLLCADRR